MKKYAASLTFFVLALIGIVIYGYKQIDWNSLNSPKKQVITNVTIKGKTIPLQDVIVTQIPQEVYVGGGTPNWEEHLVGTKKRVLFIVWNGSPYANAFRSELNKTFGKKGPLHKYYVEDIVVYKEEGARCKSKNCPVVYLMNHCGGGICIINPQTHEMIIDESQNDKQILPLLVAYANWDTEPLLKGAK